MKVISLKKDSFNKGGAVITLLPEDKEDLFTVYQIVDKDDELIFKKNSPLNLMKLVRKKV